MSKEMIKTGSQNPFQIFNLEETFDLDIQKLHKAYLTYQKESHPDRFASASSLEKGAATHLSALVNHAYQSLLNPFDRARTLLEIHCQEASLPTPDTAFLAWVMMVEEGDILFLSKEDPLYKDPKDASFSNREDVATFYIVCAKKRLSQAFKEKKMAMVKKILCRYPYLVRLGGEDDEELHGTHP